MRVVQIPGVQPLTGVNMFHVSFTMWPEGIIRHEGTLPKRRDARNTGTRRVRQERNNGNMMLNWNEYRDPVNAAVKEMAAANPDIVRAYARLNSANAKSMRIDAETRERMALAAARPSRAGVRKEEIVGALGVAVMVNAGAAMVYSARTIDAFDAKTQK